MWHSLAACQKAAVFNLIITASSGSSGINYTD